MNLFVNLFTILTQLPERQHQAFNDMFLFLTIVPTWFLQHMTTNTIQMKSFIRNLYNNNNTIDACVEYGDDLILFLQQCSLTSKI